MYNNPVITNKGYSAITHYLNNNQPLPIRRMLLSETDYTTYDLANFDIINFNINLAANTSTSKVKVKIEEEGVLVERYALKNYGIFTNETVLSAFDIKAAALTCLDENGEEIILAILTAVSPYQKVLKNDMIYTFSFILSLVFNGSDNIKIITSGEGLVTEEFLKEFTGILYLSDTKADFPTPSSEHENEIRKANDKNECYKCIKDKNNNYFWSKNIWQADLDKTIIVTIPSDSTLWTTNTDADGKTYYTKQITVEGMYADFVGTEDMQPVRPEPFNVTTWETIKEEWAKISGVDSEDGYIVVYATELLTSPIDVYIFGL